MGVRVLPVQLPVLASPPALLTEELQHLHPGQRFLDEGVHRCHRGAHPAEGRPDPAAEDPAGDEEGGHRPEGDEREGRVHPDEHRHDPDEQDHVGDDHHHPGTQQFVERIHIARRPRDDLADGVTVEPAGVQFLDVVEDVAADVAHHPLAEQVHDPGLSVGAGETDRQDDGVKAEDPDEPFQIARGDVVVEGDPGQVRPGELRRGPDQNQPHGEGDERPVRKHVGQHAPEQAPAGLPAAGLLAAGAFRAHSRESSSSSICRRYMPAYNPPAATSSSWVPLSTTWVAPAASASSR